MQNVLSFFRAHWIRIVFLLVLAVSIGMYVQNKRTEVPNWVTATVDTGTVSKVISVSGTMNATKSADLSFPQGGIVESIKVAEGDFVAQGTELIVLEHDALTAEYQDARAALSIAEADQRELISGLRPEEREVNATKVAIAKEELARVTKSSNDKVENAYRTLLSSDLEVRPIDKDNDDTAPTVTGTYTCSAGTYTLSLFRSGSKSGYSYRLSGLENGTYTAYTESPGALGTCGLSIQFAPSASYSNAEWTITIPNTESSTYVTNNNTYILAQTERDNAVRSAEQNLKLAEQNALLNNAVPREEALARERARVLQAEARMKKIQAGLKDRTLTAPFDGTVTHVAPVPGETVGLEPVITMVSKDVFELTALVPEIDVTKIMVGQKARVVFDARVDETLMASITFISPLAHEIDGVSYFETKLILDAPSSWLQSGLNADIDIIIDTHENVTRIPSRFLVTEGDAHSVLFPNGTVTKSVPVELVFEGNDGYVEVTGINPSDTIVAP